MNRTYKNLIICSLIALTSVGTLFAGNKDRSGQSGAQHLLIDPWARTNGWGNAGVAEVRGLESIFTNIGGFAFVEKTALSFSHTQFLAGSNGGAGTTQINSAAIGIAINKRNKDTKEVKNYGVLGISFFAMGFGDIAITTEDQPEGGLGTFSPNLIYIGVHYAKSFNEFIHGGASVKIVNEHAGEVSATGVGIDIGVQYVNGAYKNFKIGVALKNLGLPMRFKGDGLDTKGLISKNQDHEVTLSNRSEAYQLPALLSIGVSYDFLFFSDEYKAMDRSMRKQQGLTREDAVHRLTLAGSFIANSYSSDIFAFGIEYGFMQYFMIRAGYNIEGGFFKATKSAENKGTWNSSSNSWYIGPSAGVTAAIPLTKKSSASKAKLYIDYAYRFTYLWRGNHCIGVTLNL